MSMSKRNQHVVPHKDGWAIRAADASRATATFERKSEAVDRAREIAQNQRTELVIHGRDGQIHSRDSHGPDPFPPKG
jgi:uncharacterized protein YdaT